MAIRRETFVRLGGFDERYFVYNEDMAFGRRMREAGLRQILRGDLRVPHLGGGSGAGSSYMSRMRGASMIAYLRHHHRPAVVLVMGVHLVLIVGAFFMVGPFLWEVLTSVKTMAESTQVPPTPNPSPRRLKFSELTNGWRNSRAA